MGIKCKACGQKGIPIIEALANSTDGGMRCLQCGKVTAVNRLIRLLYRVLEGLFIILLIVFALKSKNTFTLFYFIPFVLVSRLFVLPAIGYVKKEKI